MEQGVQRSASRIDEENRRLIGCRVDEVPAVRVWAARLLADHPRLDEVLLVVGEFAANAVLHSLAGGDGAEIRLLHAGEQVEVRVRNRGAAGFGPRVRRVDGAAESGRGLLLVEALADGWGTRADGGWVTVWARFNAETGT
ncbi:ATP-binding protein [Actinorugispora endophytica]|uniref:Histidine kinase-like protein n=1 Tax=Actinorugispora endophytica TaxID=1605990 RepID=A0A4R6V5X5_9ACTN|nr:ATP-binding protein [Actinorugispora endophytica]TDQ54381.1 histidine kinase-like protein [Actinorugispora endophytica]